MLYSCPSPNISRDHIDTVVPQFMADLRASLKIKAPINPVANTAIDRGKVLGKLLVALTCKRRSQFMKAFEAMCMEDCPCDSGNSL